MKFQEIISETKNPAQAGSLLTKYCFTSRAPFSLFVQNPQHESGRCRLQRSRACHAHQSLSTGLTYDLQTDLY